MKHGLLVTFLIGLIALITSAVRADHIIGGDMSLVASGAPGNYKLIAHLYSDRTNPSSSAPDAVLYPHIFRARDNQRMLSLSPFQTDTKTLYSTNNPCGNQVKLEMFMWTYEREVSLPAATYNDPGGYYITFQRCCRYPSVTNLQDPRNTGITFRIDFKMPTTGVNSTPVFTMATPRYVCINEPFVMDFSAKDADGDKLRYEMVNPLGTHATYSEPVDRIGTSHASYPLVGWAPGTSAINAMPGAQPLRVDANSGRLTVTAGQAGLYTFAVMVTESRNGVDLSQIRRDYALPVIDCKKNTTTPPPITHNGKSTTVVERCDDSPVSLATSDETGFVYQWQLNGQDIAGATSTTLAVNDEGLYTVVKKFPYDCGTEAESQTVDVLAPVAPRANIIAERTALTFDGDQITLTAAPQPPVYTLQWLFNGASGGITDPSIVVGQEGTYRLRVSTSDGRCPSEDTIRIDRNIRFSVPNAFTPNGDRLNDTWQVINLNSLDNTEVFVFNRNGAVIYYADKNGKPWDGTYENQKVPSGTYRFMVRSPGRQPVEGALHVIY